jgi:enoyl-CoA hydratase/carnithine racemase
VAGDGALRYCTPTVANDSADDVILLRDVEHVRLITMNRPAKLNALNQALFAGIADALEAAASDDDVRVTVLTGAGRAFTAGADLTDMARAAEATTPGPGAVRDNPFDRLQRAGESFPKPLVAAVNGVGAGLGFTILGYCDFTFLAASARLRCPFTELGISPEASSSFLFPLRMGWQNAARALLAGEWFSAEDVVASGLGTAVCQDDQLLDTVLAFAINLARGSLESLQATKQLMLAPYREAVAEARDRETASMASLRGRPANADALRAFHSR